MSEVNLDPPDYNRIKKGAAIGITFGFIVALVAIWLIFFKEDKESDIRYTCDDSTKMCIQSSSGKFKNIDDCNLVCKYNYSCTKENTCVKNENGIYNKKSDCNMNCIEPKKYECNSQYQCIESTSGDFDTLEDCNNACKDPDED